MDESNLEHWFAEMRPRLHSFCGRMMGSAIDGEDIVQEALTRAAQSYAASMPIAQPDAWLFRIARNLAIDAYRQRNVRPQTTFGVDDTDSILDKTPDPDANVAEQTQALLKNQQVQKALTSLPQVQRRVIEMAYFYGMTRQEIAEATGEALGTIHTRARLGLQKLREELEREEFEE